MAGIKDVAKRAQVGVGTVSRMLNNSGYVSEETREKIEAAMREMNYTPNELARNLYHKRTGIIAVIVPNISHPFFAAFLNHAEEALYEIGYKMMVCNTEKERNAEREYLDMLDRHIVDGIITGVHTLDVEVYQRIRKPIVALDRYLGENIPVVALDHREGGALAANELLLAGCRRVLHFTGAPAVGSPYHQRHIEFERRMKEQGVEVISFELEWNRMDPGYYQEAVRGIFAEHVDFDGVFGVDGLAIACMNEAYRRGLRVPQDMKIVAYDGTYLTEMVEPKLTAVVQPIEELARESVRLIKELIDGGSPVGHQFLLPARLRIGGSTREERSHKKG